MSVVVWVSVVVAAVERVFAVELVIVETVRSRMQNAVIIAIPAAVAAVADCV